MVSTPVPVLEIGGSHVTAALIDLTAIGADADCHDCVTRVELDPGWPRDRLLAAFSQSAAQLPVTGGQTWTVAIPGPFDYERGIAWFTDEAVGKFAALHGLDLRQSLLASLPGQPAGVRFVNDAEAFGLGECAVGSGQGYTRVVCLTLGSGIGSAFVAEGRIVADGPTVPPNGHAYLISYRGEPLEDAVSRRAIRRRFAARSGGDADVHEIAELARGGDPVALEVLDAALLALGEAIGPWCASFEAEALVVGGAISESWDLVAPPLRAGLVSADPSLAALVVAKATSGPTSQLVGTALGGVR